MKIVSGLIKIGKVIVDHGPQILTAFGIVGFISSTIAAVKSTPEAVEALKAAEEEKGEELTTKEVVKCTWKFYIFPVIATVLSIACIIWARKIDSGRTAALLTACKVTEEASQQFDAATREVVGEKEYDKIKNKVAENKIKENPYVEGNVINTRTGNTLYYEPHSNVYLRASRDFIDKGLNAFNKELWNRQTMTLNDYLECFQLPKLNPRTTGALEWRLEDVMKECKDLPELIFDYFEIETGEVCGYFSLEVDPKAPKYREYS